MKGFNIQVFGLVLLLVTIVLVWYFAHQSWTDEKNIIIKSDYAISARNDLELAKRAVLAATAVTHDVTAFNKEFTGNMGSDVKIEAEKLSEDASKVTMLVTITVTQPKIGLELSEKFNVVVSKAFNCQYKYYGCGEGGCKPTENYYEKICDGNIVETGCDIDPKCTGPS